MLFWVFQQLAGIDSFFNVFGYITLRTILAALTALLLSLVLGPWFIRRLVRQQMGQPINFLVQLCVRPAAPLKLEGKQVTVPTDRLFKNHPKGNRLIQRGQFEANSSTRLLYLVQYPDYFFHIGKH